VTGPEIWQVRIALERSEWDALRRAMFLVVPSERWTILLSPGDEVGDDETATLLLDVAAESHADAEAEAARLYARAREEAGLAPAAPSTLGVRTPIFGPSPWSRLLEEARRLIETGRNEMAVIRAQTAAELFARQALTGLTAHLREDDERLGTLFPKLSLVDRRSRALLHAITGSEIDKQNWWSAYRIHVERRNAVVHDALVVSPEEAGASREAVRAFMTYLNWLWAGQPVEDHLRPRPPA
jgi:HEPN domain-containing protein